MATDCIPLHEQFEVKWDQTANVKTDTFQYNNSTDLNGTKGNPSNSNPQIYVKKGKNQENPCYSNIKISKKNSQDNFHISTRSMFFLCNLQRNAKMEWLPPVTGPLQGILTSMRRPHLTWHLVHPTSQATPSPSASSNLGPGNTPTTCANFTTPWVARARRCDSSNLKNPKNWWYLKSDFVREESQSKKLCWNSRSNSINLKLSGLIFWKDSASQAFKRKPKCSFFKIPLLVYLLCWLHLTSLSLCDVETCVSTGKALEGSNETHKLLQPVKFFVLCFRNSHKKEW